LLFCYPQTPVPETPFSRTLIVPESIRENWARCINYFIKTPAPLQPCVFSPTAQNAFNKYYDRLPQLQRDREAHHFQSVLGKMYGYLARFSLILHALEQAAHNETDPKREIPEKHVHAAWKLVEYFSATSRIALRHLTRDTGFEKEERVLKWIRAKQKS